MDQAEKLNRIIEQYYAEILKYCHSLLISDPQGAKDCTQEVFLILTKKHRLLDMEGKIRIWLYKTADKVIRNYRRREAKQCHLSLDEIQLADDGGLSELLNDSLLDLLTEDDKALITAYYSTEFASKQEVADRFGLTLPALYTAVHRIKKNLRDMINLNKK